MEIKYKIVLVPFPFDDLNLQKVRPAICLTEAVGKFEHVIVAYITSRIPGDAEKCDVIIESTSLGFDKTGLILTSVIRLHRVMTIPSNIIKREIGHLPDQLKIEVTTKLRRLFFE